MSATRERYDELMADRALWGLSDVEQSELESAMQQMGLATLDESWDVAAGAATAACLGAVRESAPPELVSKLQSDAISYFAEAGGLQVGSTPEILDSVMSRMPPQPPAQAPQVAGPTASSRLGWWVAAAAILLSAVLAWSRWAPIAPVSAQRDALLASGGELLQIAWNPGTSELRGEPSGDVVWSDREQRGFMRFSGLPSNDATKRQYQLWIFDRQRLAEKPVDGGVFDIPPGTSEVIVPIDAKIRVHEAFAFAVTVEEPGGVVVSDREHIVTTAGL